MVSTQPVNSADLTSEKDNVQRTEDRFWSMRRKEIKAYSELIEIKHIVLEKY